MLNKASIVNIIETQPFIVYLELLNENQAALTFRPPAPASQKRFGPKTFSPLCNTSKSLMKVPKEPPLNFTSTIKQIQAN